MKITIRIQNSKKEIVEEKTCTFEGQVSLTWVLEQFQLKLPFVCGGNGTCGKCQIQFLEGAPVPTKQEEAYFTEEEIKKGFRLACQTKVSQDCLLLWRKQNTRIQALQVEAKHIQGALGERLGVAVDLGTTTIALAFVDLECGQVAASVTLENPQRAFGADVMSRMQQANQGAGELLAQSVREALKEEITTWVKEQETKHHKKLHIEKVVIAGNTAMCHLLRKDSCETLAVAPFVPVTLDKTIHNVDGVKVIILPGASAFIGGDIIAGLLCLDFAKDERPKLLLDLGTNGEMVLWDGKEFFATSAAAGPALEGGNISCGIASVYGAIYEVLIVGKRNQSKTIGNVNAIGICGSGLLSCISGLLQNRILDQRGSFVEAYRKSGYKLDTPGAKAEIVITQEDVRAFQMAKSAVASGVEYLLQQMDNQEPVEVFLAGGLGVHIKMADVYKTGLLPSFEKTQCHVAGNTALQGAISYLLQEKEMEQTIQFICSHMHTMQLNEWASFEDTYIKYLDF